ncbi:MAG: carboxymuconolactone decarboxylase family protein [Betaproteobacteria bacterium]|nr:carboxymuconolactone decarboxylase family protein [Betaproteobacteria bacterium]
MNARIELSPLDELTGEIAHLAKSWKAMGSDTTFLRMLNHRADLVPAFFDFYIRLRGAGLLPAKLKELVRLRIARLNTCRYCLGSLSPLAEKEGVTDRHIAELEHRPAGLFTEQELAAFDLAEALWTNASAAGQDVSLRDCMRQHFTDAQLLELVWAIAMFIGLGRMIVFFGIEREE